MKVLCELWLDVIKPSWSKLRWKYNDNKYNFDIEIEKTLNGIEKLAKSVYSVFEWTMDGVSQLFDAYRHPYQCYNDYITALQTGKKIKDDCDGFHTVLYYILEQNQIPSGLLTIVDKNITQSHTVCIFYLNFKYYIIDYDKIYNGYTSLDNCVTNYILQKKYNYLYSTIHKFSYDKNKFYKTTDI